MATDIKLSLAVDVEVYNLAMSNPPDATERWFAFCQTISVEGGDIDEQFVVDYLSPWTWECSHVMVAFDGDAPSDPEKIKLEPKPDRPGIEKTMEISRNRTIAAGFDNFKKGDGKVGKVTDRQHPWAGVLRAAGGYPDGLPQALNIVRYFKLEIPDDLPAGAKVIVAPVVTLGGTGKPERSSAANGPTKKDDRYTWKYTDEDDEPSLTANISPTYATAGARGGFRFRGTKSRPARHGFNTCRRRSLKLWSQPGTSSPRRPLSGSTTASSR